MRYRFFESKVLFALGFTYVVTSLVQFFALFDLIGMYGLSRIARFCLATVIGYTPIVGTFAGLFAVLQVWHFSLLKTILIFAPIGFCGLFVTVIFTWYWVKVVLKNKSKHTNKTA
ncbi:MAG: hypothetical protein JJW01_00285 [Alphaproteobacteria bacterium]|nr:hypothetical protein [Rickettsiales bacterium]